MEYKLSVVRYQFTGKNAFTENLLLKTEDSNAISGLYLLKDEMLFLNCVTSISISVYYIVRSVACHLLNATKYYDFTLRIVT